MEEMELASMEADLSRPKTFTQTTIPEDGMESFGSTTNSIVRDRPLVGSPQNDNTSPFKEKNIGVEPSKQTFLLRPPSHKTMSESYPEWARYY
jgi:hypothetical protein